MHGSDRLNSRTGTGRYFVPGPWWHSTEQVQALVSRSLQPEERNKHACSHHYTVSPYKHRRQRWENLSKTLFTDCGSSFGFVWFFLSLTIWTLGLPRQLNGKEPTCQCKRCGRSLRFDPWVGKIPWRRKWLPTPIFLSGKIPWTEALQSMGSQLSKCQTQLSN